MDNSDRWWTGILIGMVLLIISISIHDHYKNRVRPETYYINVDVVVKGLQIHEGDYKGHPTYDRRAVVCLCQDTTICREWSFPNDSAWYNLKPGQIHHFDYARKSFFWKLK